MVTFCCNCTGSGKKLCQAHFDHLNFPTPNGHYLAMGSDDHRSELLANGNVLAIYYNSLNTGWTTNDGATSAAAIEQYSRSRFTSTGPRPDWILLNEISTSQWPGNQAYRTWVHDVVHALHNTYGYSVILYAPFSNPGANDADWQKVEADAYIGVEDYLSGAEIQAANFSVSWCQSQYNGSISSYNARGVPTSRLFLGEYFSQSLAGVGWGRAGVSSDVWDQAILARSLAAANTAFPGYIGYAWGSDKMEVSTEEMIHFEDTYASCPLPGNVALTVPYLIVQPQSQTVGTGATVGFSVVPAGNAPLTYQWRFNGNNLSGCTGAALTLTNVGPANAGSLSVPGLEPAAGNGVTYGNTSPASPAPRMNLGSAYTSGSLYYSFAFQVVNLANLDAGLSLLAGFNNTAGPQSAQPTVYGTWFVARRSGSGYNVGLNKYDGLAGDTTWDTSVHTTGETLFVIGRYTFNPNSTTDDTSALWINPDPATFGNGAAPAPTLTASAGNNISSGTIRSFLLRDAVPTQPLVIVDELRIGTSWASVTPPSAAPARPILSAARAGSRIVLSWPTYATGFTVETNGTLSNPASWSALSAPVYTVGNQFVVTNSLGPDVLFYRLRWP